MPNRTWIIDSGSCVDLIQRSDLSNFEKQRVELVAEPERLYTANGPTCAEEQVSVRIGSCDSTAKVFVMDNSLAVLSLGKLVQEKGFSFEWKPGCPPSLRNDKGKYIHVEVKDLVPVLASPVVSCPVQEGGASSSSDGPPMRGANPPAQTWRNPGKPTESTLDPSHYLTHVPKDSRCEICSNCKIQKTPHRRKKPGDKDAETDEIKAEKFGDLVTADHIILGSEIDFSRHGDTAALGCQDFVTKWIGAYLAPRKPAEESMRALRHFAGKEKVSSLCFTRMGQVSLRKLRSV